MLEEERDFEKGLTFPLQTMVLYGLYCLRGTRTIKIATEALRTQPRRSQRI